MTTEKKFDAAVNVIKNLPKNGAYQPSDELKLRFYSYYKQATQGPCKISKPAFWQFVKRAKWDAWSSLGEMTKDEAMNNYIEELKGIIETMSYNEDVAAFLDSLDSFYENTSVQDFHAKVETAIEQSNLQADSLFSDSSEDSERTMLYRENEKDESFTNSFETSLEIIYNTNTYLPETEPEEEFTDSLDFASDNFSKEFLKNYIDEITPELQYIKHESKHNYNLSSDINFLQSNGISTKYDKTIFNHDVNENMDHNSTQQNMDFMNQVMITLRQLQNNLDQVVNRIGNIEDKMQYSIKKPINSNNGKNRINFGKLRKPFYSHWFKTSRKKIKTYPPETTDYQIN